MLYFARNSRSSFWQKKYFQFCAFCQINFIRGHPYRILCISKAKIRFYWCDFYILIVGRGHALAVYTSPYHIIVMKVCCTTVGSSLDSTGYYRICTSL